MILLGLGRDGELHDAYQVPRGLNCGMVCPACKMKLVAKQGKVKAWHFAHYSRSASDDGGCAESVLHLLSKELITKSVGKYLILPSSIQRWLKQPQGATPLPPTKRFRIQSVDTEKRLSLINRQVDAWVTLSSDQYLQSTDIALEFNVHHAKDSDTIEDFEEANLSVLEVDLSHDKVLEISDGKGLSIVDALSSLILAHTDNKRWLSHRKYGRNLMCKHPDLIGCGKPECLCPCSYCVGEITQINADIEVQQREKERLQEARERLANPVILHDIIKKVLRRSRGKHLEPVLKRNIVLQS